LTLECRIGFVDKQIADDIASDEMLLMNLLLMTSSLQEHFSSDASSFIFVDSIALNLFFQTL